MSHGGGGGCVPSPKLAATPWSGPLDIAFGGPRYHETANVAMTVKHTSLFEYIYILRIVRLD